jgi:hypothetical protein
MKTLKKVLLYFVSISGLCLTSVAIIVACSGEPDPYDYYTSFFHPDVQGKKDYGAFYFTDYHFTYGEEEPASEAAINSAEWSKYLGGKVTADDVEEVMYRLDTAGKESVHQFLNQNPQVADSLARNNFLLSLKDAEHEAARKYYQFALEAELLGQSNYNYWEPAPLDTTGLKDEATKALQLATSENDNVLKLRYYYQAQKLNHYAGNYAEAKDIYEQYIARSVTKSHVKGWALALVAGEERRLGDTVKAAYLFSKVFADYPERRLQAYRNYHYIEPPFDQVLKLARTPDEKANLYAIKGFANPEVETADLEQVYNNAPASPLVGVLLVREINKLEQYYLTPALNNNNDQFYSDRSSITKPQQQKNLSNWPLWVGLVVSLAGIIVCFAALKKQPDKPGFKIAGGVLALAACIVWFAMQKSHTKTEEQLSQGSFFVAMPDSVKTKYDAHIEKLRKFCKQLAGDDKYMEPQIGTIVNAYLYFMQNKPGEGLAVLNDFIDNGADAKLVDQKQIVKLLLSAQGIKQLKAVDEVALLPSLQWLNNKVIAGIKPKRDVYPPTPNDENQFAKTQRNFYNYVLAPAYLRQGDTARAALAMLNSNEGDIASYNWYISRDMPDFWFNYLHSAQLKQIIKWKSQQPSDKYLAFLCGGLKGIKNDNLFELLGTISLREHNYAAAATAFSQIKGKKIMNAAYNGQDYYSDSESNQGDPFVTQLNDYPKYFIGKRYTKLTFARKMAQLESQLQKEPKNADAYYQMANALYNTSAYGNSWGLITYIWSSTDLGRKKLYYYDGDFIKASNAKQYYLKARELSNDPEYKAKCTFMAAKCEQKQHERPSYMDDYKTYDEREKQYMKQQRENSYFKEMQQYKTTAFYQKAINECSYLNDFISSN